LGEEKKVEPFERPVLKPREKTGVEGQKAWERTGMELSQEELDELRRLREKQRNGQKLSYAERDRLFTLGQRENL